MQYDALSHCRQLFGAFAHTVREPFLQQGDAARAGERIKILDLPFRHTAEKPRVGFQAEIPPQIDQPQRKFFVSVFA